VLGEHVVLGLPSYLMNAHRIQHQYRNQTTSAFGSHSN
jgi:hypothetical protein